MPRSSWGGGGGGVAGHSWNSLMHYSIVHIGTDSVKPKLGAYSACGLNEGNYFTEKRRLYAKLRKLKQDTHLTLSKLTCMQSCNRDKTIDK